MRNSPFLIPILLLVAVVSSQADSATWKVNPTSGDWNNLPDGGIVSVNGNNLQADYQGGDGNDLTLMVVP